MAITLNARDLASEALEALLACLSRVPGISAKALSPKRAVSGGEPLPDMAARVTGRGARRVVIGEFNRNGQPRVAREAAQRLLRIANAETSAYPVFVAPFISDETASLLEGLGVGFLDLAGNCRMSFDGVYIERRGIPNRFVRKNNLRSLYAPRAERILRVLLQEPGRAWRTRALAGEAGVSVGLVVSTKKLLLDREWLADGADGIALAEPERLLTDWASNYDRSRSPSLDCYALDGIDDIERRVADAAGKRKTPYALAGLSASARIAPSVRYARVSAYASGDLDAFAREAGLKPVTSGANAVLMAPYDEGVYYRSTVVDGIRIVSAIQAYLDARADPTRGEEAAQFLLETEIKPRWKAAAPTRKKR